MRLTYPVLWSTPSREASQEQTINTCAALARQGVEVTLLMPQGTDDAHLTAQDLRDYFHVEGDFRLVQRPSRWAGVHVLPSTIWMRQAFRDPEVRSADILYSRIPVMLALGGGSPVLFAGDHYRPWPDDWPWLRPLIRRTARSPRCLGFIIHSDYSAQSYLRAGVASEKVLVAHNGADPERMLPRLEKAEARTVLGLPQDRRIAVYAGRINKEKGLDQILALARLRPETLFLLVGSEREGAIEIEAAAIGNILVLPWQVPSALPPYLYAADILLLPAARAPLEEFRNSVLSMKIFQYLAAGRPILAPLAPDTAELLRHGDTAWLIAPDQPQIAAEAIDRLLGDISLAEQLEAGARHEVSDLSWDHRAEKIVAFLAARFAAVAAR